eukprot:3747148-Rhodomonas_salina.2
MMLRIPVLILQDASTDMGGMLLPGERGSSSPGQPGKPYCPTLSTCEHNVYCLMLSAYEHALYCLDYPPMNTLCTTQY